MQKIALAAAILALPLGAAGAIAQTGPGAVAPELSQPKPGQLLNQDYITSSGETVPRPGVPQASGPTPLDRSINQRDNRIDRSICSNC